MISSKFSISLRGVGGMVVLGHFLKSEKNRKVPKNLKTPPSHWQLKNFSETYLKSPDGVLTEFWGKSKVLRKLCLSFKKKWNFKFSAGRSWREVLSGRYALALSDSGAITTAVPMRQNEKFHSLEFSKSGGKSWQKVKFSNNQVTIDAVLSEPGWLFIQWKFRTMDSQSKDKVPYLTLRQHTAFRKSRLSKKPKNSSENVE